MAPSPNHPLDFATPLSGVIRGASAIFCDSFDKRQRAKAGETTADDDRDEDMLKATGIAAE